MEAAAFKACSSWSFSSWTLYWSCCCCCWKHKNVKNKNDSNRLREQERDKWVKISYLLLPPSDKQHSMTEGAAAGSLTLKSNLISYSLLARQGPSSEEWWTAALWNTQVLLEKRCYRIGLYQKSHNWAVGEWRKEENDKLAAKKCTSKNTKVTAVYNNWQWQVLLLRLHKMSMPGSNLKSGKQQAASTSTTSLIGLEVSMKALVLQLWY